MAVELKDVLGYLGIPEDIESIDDLKEQFGTTYIKRDMVKTDKELAGQIWGMKSGILQKKIGKIAEQVGFEIPDKTYKSQTHEETLQQIIDHVTVSYTEKIEALETQGAGKGGEAIKGQYEKELKKLKKELDDTKTLLGNVTTEYDTFKGETTKQKKSSMLKDYFGKAKEAVKLSKELDPLRLKGLDAEFNELYDFEVNEEMTEVYPVLRENGQRVKSAKKASSFADGAELYEGLAIKHKALDMTPDQSKGKPIKKDNHFQVNKDGNEAGDGNEKIHPLALKAMQEEEKLNAENK